MCIYQQIIIVYIYKLYIFAVYNINITNKDKKNTHDNGNRKAN